MAHSSLLAPPSLWQAGYYYYLLFVDGYSKSSEKSSLQARQPRKDVPETSCSASRAATGELFNSALLLLSDLWAHDPPSQSKQ